MKRGFIVTFVAAVLAACSGSHDMLPPRSGSGVGQAALVLTPPAVVQSASGKAACVDGANAVKLTTQPAAGDLVLIYTLSNATGSTQTAPTGFQQEDNQNNDLVFYEYYKIASGTEGTTYNVTSNCSGSRFDWFAVEISNENQSAPFDGHSVALTSLNSTTGPFATNSLTPKQTDDLPVAVLDAGSSGQTLASTSPTTLTAIGPIDFSAYLLHDSPVSSLSSYSASMTLSSANSWAHQIQVLDLIAPNASSTATPSPSPTPTAQPSVLGAAAIVQSASGKGACVDGANTVKLSTQPAAGDLVVIYTLSNAGTANPQSVPSGFTQEDYQDNDLLFYEYYKIASGTEGTTYTVTSTCSSGRFDWFAIEVSGENQSTPFDGHSVAFASLNSSTGPFATNALTPKQLDDLPIALLDAGSTGQTYASLSPATLSGIGPNDFSSYLFHDVSLASLSSYSASMTLSSANSWPHQIEVLDLIAGATAAATSTPSPTPTPVPTPTSTPPSGGTAASIVQSADGKGACVDGANTVKLSAQPAAGDLVLIYTLTNASTIQTAPSGFTQKDYQNNDLIFYEYYKIATGTEGTSYSVSSTCSSGRFDWFALDVSGESQSAPFDGHSVAFSSLNSTTGPFSTNSLTPAQYDDLPIAVLDAGSTGQTYASLSPATLSALGPVDFSGYVVHDVGQTSLSPYSASMTLSSANSWPHQIQVLDLIASAAPAMGTLSASPDPFDVEATGSQTINVTEAGYRGNYTVTTSNSTIVSIPDSTVTATSNTTAIPITVNTAGNVNVTITDSNGNSVVVPVVVTLTTVTIS